jgi:hypothetical protein
MDASVKGKAVLQREEGVRFLLMGFHIVVKQVCE